MFASIMFALIRSAVPSQRLAAPLSRGIYAARVLAADDSKPPSDPSESDDYYIPEENYDNDLDIEAGVLGADPVEAFMPIKDEEVTYANRHKKIPDSEPVSIKPKDWKSSKDEEVKPLKDKKAEERRVWLGFKGWMDVESQKYRKMKPHATNYVGGRYPFPLNPFFNPRPPIADSVKESLYKEYLEDPVRNTPRVLSEKYRISIKRAEGIIKLKAIEHHKVAYGEIVLQKNFTSGMESMLGVRSMTGIMEPQITKRTSVSGPRFHAVPEGEAFGPVEAAEVLGRKPFQQIVDRLAASTPYIVDYEGLDEKFAPRPQKKLSDSEKRRLDALGSATDKLIETNEALTNRRWKYVFTDIGKNKDMKDRVVLIRDKDGSLKEAGRDYKLKRYGQLW
ncbi:hypothetical protein IWW49_003807 [Coemansia sp. RSA 1797]|nr:hypothetical protein IWW49_003807 [Coemansia sp. RSA 1797]